MKTNFPKYRDLKNSSLTKKTLLLVLMLFVLACEDDTIVAQEEKELDIPEFDGTLLIGATTGKKITSFLTGVNTVYAHEDMTTWSDGQKLNHLKNMGISVLRYPEGHQTSFWDWEFPYHGAYTDIWAPSYESTLTQGKLDELKEANKNRMDIDDFFEICIDGDIEPVVGINMFQGWRYDRTPESIEKAVKLVEYCLEKDPTISYFFLDNEAGHQPEKNNHVPIEDYIQLIPAYSKAIKAVHPGAKLIPNIMRWNVVERMIRETGQYWDVFDQHWYYGSSDRWAYFNLNEWRSEVESEKHAGIVADFKKWKEQYNMNHLELSYMEWNAPKKELAAGSNPASLSYTLMGLIQADMLMWFAKNDIYMATAWPLMWEIPGQDTNQNEYNRNLLDRDDSSWVSPSATIFRAYSYVQNGEILENNNNASNGLRVLTVKRDQNNGYAVLILNKSKKDQTLEIVAPNGIEKVIEAQSFKEGSGTHNVQIETLSPELKDDKIYPTIEGTSFVYLLFE